MTWSMDGAQFVWNNRNAGFFFLLVARRVTLVIAFAFCRKFWDIAESYEWNFVSLWAYLLLVHKYMAGTLKP